MRNNGKGLSFKLKVKGLSCMVTPKMNMNIMAIIVNFSNFEKFISERSYNMKRSFV